MEVKQSTRILEVEGYTNAKGVAYILMRTSTFAFSLIFFSIVSQFPWEPYLPGMAYK